MAPVENCSICGDPIDARTCTICRARTRHEEDEKQQLALEKGRAAVREGRAVIYIHGRPYADPGEPEPPENRDESPFPWDLWDE